MEQVLLSIGSWFEVLPTLGIEKIVLLCIDHAINRTICCYDIKWY